MDSKRRLALMIDADNAQASLLPQILAEVNKYGVTVIRRVYGDWTTTQLKGWKELLHSHALQPMQQFSFTAGKNATDCSLIIDAMDIIYSADVDGICIVSSDSDYTRLATRIRESNLFVMGIGRKATSPAFVNACDVFAYTEKLCLTSKSNGIKPTASKSKAKPTATKAP
ncbi:MAG: NYN domain-containing protein, partial [Anaerolineae bacterium]|nr:NYN domain-containing protein [Anaerolineae bacterium]